MNKVPLIISIIALIGVIVLFVGQKSKSGEVQKVGNGAEMNAGIAYVNLDTLIESYNYYTDRKTELIEKGEKKSASIQAKIKSFQLKVYDLQKSMQDKMLTQATAEKKQKALGLEEQQIMQEKQMAEIELAEDNQKMMLEMLDSVKNYLKIYNKEHNFKVIFANDTLGQSILLASKGMNISKPVVDALNERYLTTKVTANK